MPLVFSFRHMDTSEALEIYTEQKLKQTTNRYDAKAERIEVIFTAETPQRLVCSVTVSHQGNRYHADDSGNYVYDCVDRVVDKIDSLMRKAHSKAKPRHESLRVVNEEDATGDDTAISL